jgi:hypothetical protein
LPPYSRGGEAQFTLYEREAAAGTEERDRGSEPDSSEEHSGWRRFADRVRAFLGKAAEQFGEYLRDEASGTPEEERGPWVRFIGAGRKVFGGYFHHDGERLAEGLEEAKALAIQEALRRLDAAGPLDDGHGHAHHPPDEHHRDPSRPGVDVEPPEPDDRPQDGQETPLSAWADAAELWAWENAQQAAESGVEGPEADETGDPSPCGLDGWDVEP